MLAVLLLAAVVRVVPASPDAAPPHVVLSLDGKRTIRVATNTAIEVGDAKNVQVVDSDWWSPLVATPDQEIPLWRAAELNGTVSVERSVAVPRELEATFDLKGRRVTAVCPVDDGAWKCRLPRTKLDLRIAAKDFVPQYLWDVDLARPRPVAIALKRGGSIAGWLAAVREDVLLDTAIVKLTPATYGESDDRSLLVFKAKATKRGFFQFTGVAAGRWLVVAEAPDLSPSPVAELEVDDRNETTLRDPLLLRDLAELTVAIHPEVYRSGAPWRVRLSRRPPHSRSQEHVADGPASESGEWSYARLAAGEYDVDVMSPRGAVLATKRVTVAPDMPPLRIEIDRVPVRGKVHIGGDGIAAVLKFSSNRGESVSTTSKDDGEFTVDVPFEGKWLVDVRLRDTKQELSNVPAVTIEREDGESHASVDLELPGGRIAGRVVDESGKPADSGVIITRDGSILADIRAREGTFELVGVEPGPAIIQAQANGRSSGLVPVSIDVLATPITLTLRGSRKLEGFVITPSGNPVAGASIHYIEPGAAFGGDVVTSPTGRFVIELSASTNAVGVAIAAPGLPSKLALLRVPERREPMELVMGRSSGRLIVPIRDSNWPTLGREGAWANVLRLVEPIFGRTAPRWATKEGMVIDLEPGQYTLCPTHIPSNDCVAHTILPGATIIASVK